MSEPAAIPIPRRGRGWVIAALLLALVALAYAAFQASTREPGREAVRVEGIGSAQATFGGVRQAGDRLGSADAPVSVQIFNDLQCSGCAAAFLETIPPLVENRVRRGEARLLMRHYSFAPNPTEVGFFAAEAAADQGYGWHYTYLFFRNQEEARRFRIDERFLETLAGSIGELDVGAWRERRQRESGEDGAITATLERYEELGRNLGIRAQPAAVVNGPAGTRILQDSPSLAQLEAAIDAVGP